MSDPTILDYAPPKPRKVRDLLAKLRDPAIVLGVALLSGVIAWFAQPPKYTSTAYVQLVLAWDAGVDPADVKNRIARHSAAMSQPPTGADAPWTPEEYRRKLQIKPAIDGTVIGVSFTDTDAKRAADAVNALLARYVGVAPQRNQPDLQAAILAAPSTKGHRSWAIAGAGFGVGMLVAIIVLLLVRRARPIPAMPPAR